MSTMTPPLVGVARRAGHDRHEVRLWHGAVRRLHRACRRRRHAVLHHRHRQRRHLRDHNHRGDRRDGGGGQDPAGLARPRGRPMRLLPVGPDHVGFGVACRATHIRRMPTSTTRCPATSAAAGPMSAFAKRSSTPRNRAERRADDDPRSYHFPPRRAGTVRVGERSLPAQVPAGRRGRGRRPDAQSAVCRWHAAKPQRPKPMASRPTPSSASTATGRYS